MFKKILVFFIFIVTLAFIFIKPLIIYAAKRQLMDVFVKSQVSIASYDFRPLRLLSFSVVEIKNEPFYDLKFKQLRIEYNVRSILARRLSKVFLEGPEITLNLSGQSLFEAQKYIKLIKAGGAFLADSLEVSNLRVNVKSKELNLDCLVSADLSLAAGAINFLDIKIFQADAGGLNLKDAFLKLDRFKQPGFFSINKLKYNKVNIRDIQSGVKLTDKTLIFEPLTAHYLNGTVEGGLNLVLGENPAYSGSLRFINLDLETFINDFELSQRVYLNGKLAGALAIKSSRANLQALNGDFSSLSPGILAIKDNGLIQNMAEGASLPADILVESFKNYHYNKGIMKLHMDKGNLVFDIAMEGETGKRNLNIVLHNFKLI